MMMLSVARKGGNTDTGARRILADEADLVRRCRDGDPEAQQEFYVQYRRPVAANLYRVLNDRTDLDDLVQEVFVIAFRGLTRFRGDARLSTWLYRICVNVALGRIRARARRPPPLLVAEPVGELAASTADDPERSLQRRQERERVYRALEAMAPKKRLVLYLHEIEGMDLKDIAYIVGANPVTVRTRLHYARKEFYGLIAAEEGAS
jgi:RNA polymerase sigma-70 factor, ECF subfamily